MPEYVVEMLVDGDVTSAVVEDNPLSVEVYEFVRDTHYYIGNTEPIDPSVLVWYDTSQPTA